MISEADLSKSLPLIIWFKKNVVCQVFDKIHGPCVNTEVQLSERFIQYIILSESTEDYEELLY